MIAIAANVNNFRHCFCPIFLLISPQNTNNLSNKYLLTALTTKNVGKSAFPT